MAVEQGAKGAARAKAGRAPAKAAAKAAATTEPRKASKPKRERILRRVATIVNRRGLHARAAAKFAKLAGGFEATVEVSRNDMTVTADSIMGLMMLAAAPGCEIELQARGREAAGALDALIALVADGFEEDD